MVGEFFQGAAIGIGCLAPFLVPGSGMSLVHGFLKISSRPGIVVLFYFQKGNVVLNIHVIITLSRAEPIVSLELADVGLIQHFHFAPTDTRPGFCFQWDAHR